MEDWLRDDSDAWKVCALDRELGGRYPLRPDVRSLEDYRHAALRRITDALDNGRLSAVLREARKYGAGVHREAPAAAAPPPSEEPAGLALVVRTPSGQAVEDEAGFFLLHPDGRSEPVKLSGGRFDRPQARHGEYRARFKHLRGACWSASEVRCGEEVELSVQASSFEDGAAVVFEVRERWDLHGEPLATLQAQVSGGAARATWRHRQENGAPARGEYVFRAVLGHKHAESDVLRVEPHDTSTFTGVKERLVQFGYDCGAPGPESTPELERALKAFQGGCGFAAPTGRCDPATIDLLKGLT